MDCLVQGDLTFQLLEEITDGFSKDRKLGSGSYGKVYMGVQKDGTKIAVKLLYDNPGLDEEQFQNEFNHLRRLQHQNIVRLVGSCYESEEQIVEYKGKFVLAEKRYRALCLEYMHKGNLEMYLSDEYNEHDWPTCYAIIMGICKGLKYLHEELKPPTYHLDLKPANVLLDENMRPKIADFGLSRFFGEEQTRITRSSIGTHGYTPPEYIDMGMISVKFDIFSLGVIIIKIMAGRTGYFKVSDMSSEQFIELVHGNWSNRTHAISVFAMESYSKQVKTCIKVALRCVEADRHKRPCIGEIINTLNETGTIIHELSQSLNVLTLDSWSLMQQMPVVSVVTGALEPILETLSILLGDEYRLSKGVRGETRFLINELAGIHAFILKLSEEEDPDLQDKVWMIEVRELSYDIDDSINEFMQCIENKVIKQHRFIKSIRNSVGKMRKMDARIGSEFKDLQKQTGERSERYARYKSSEGFSWAKSVSIDPRALAIFENASKLVGIDKPKAGLIKLLTEEDECASTQRLEVVSIVGLGGVGKTTLAYQLYQELKMQFMCGAFVSISRNPDIVHILRDVLSQVGNQLYASTESHSIEQLISMIADFLENKRYFIVFDDIWEVATWDIIKRAICWTSCGSRIITTTRVIDVARSCSSSIGHVYRLKPLSMMHSRQLFYRRIFNSEEDCPSHLEEVSRDILNKCDGLPLAIIAISGLLADRSTKDQWDQVSKSIAGTLERNYNIEGMMKILSLSFFDLPPPLKTCLLYLSVFPEGYIIEKQELIRRWIAEGFIHKKNRYTEHELGEKYFNELINRGLIHPEKTDKYDKVKSCLIHDVVLDFIISKSIEENFVTFAGIPGLAIAPQSKVRRLSLQDGNNILPMSVVLSHTRSLNVFGNSAEIPCLDEFLHLRVLNFRGCNQLLNHHLANISRLFQLRSLNLRDTGVSELPEEVGHLECLEMLELRGTDVRELPAAIVNLRKLVHLLTDIGVKFPDGIAKMQALEVLKHVSAFEQSFNFLQELGQLQNLRKLHLNFDGFASGDTTRVKQWMEAIAFSLDKLCAYSIRCLTIVEDGSFLQEVWSPTSSSLQKLMIRNSAILWVPNWVGSLVNLQQLRLEVDGVSQKDLFILGGLPSLLILDLIGTEKSEDRLTVNNGVGFPCLRQFCYYILDEGMDLTFASGSMPKLEKLMIHCNAAKTSYAFDFGIENLPCLTSVKFRVLGSVESAVEAAKAAMERAANSHPNHPSVCFE